MVKRIRPFVFFSLFIFSCFNIFAADSKRVEEIKVKNLNSWQEEFDLSDKKAGKYNIMITAEDFGGNVSVAGPHNIYVDPKSDKPVCGVTSPSEGMKVAGNLNIVGTAIDDDGISKIELVLDEGLFDSDGVSLEKTVIADGTEFWSYYLDTNNLEEGPHTIKVTAYDINSEPVVSDPVIVKWQLDRQLPVTEIFDKEMGLLVSGKVNFYGQVSDGNGIESLEYSVDGGKLFDPIKLKKTKNKGVKEFSISVDTKKFEDGPSVLWFRAKDLAGSVGLYSFLYFIDNTKPDVKIVYPGSEDVLNGKITVTGYAKDKIGVTGLRWSFGKDGGDIDLIAGNPYWAVNIDTTGSKDKSGEFVITAIDKANNEVSVSKKINFNQLADIPSVTLFEPVQDQLFTENDSLVVRGLATDDDKIASVSIRLDNNDAVIQENNGVYNLELKGPGELSTGTHKVTVIAKDINGVESEPVVVSFVSKQELPVISNPIINGSGGKKNIDFVNGIEIHPESGSSISIPVRSSFGLKNVHYKLTWGKEGISEFDIPLENKNDYTVNIPVNPDSVKGVMNLSVTATDSMDRVSNFSGIYYVTNLSEIKSNENKIVFDDSRIGEDGVIICDEDYPVSGYVLGERASSVSIVPYTPFAKAKLVGNQIKITTVEKEGVSDPVNVKVTLESGRVIRSQQFVFKCEKEKPEISLRGTRDFQDIYGKDGDVEISGRASSAFGIDDIGYRIIPISTDIKNYVINKISLGRPGEIVWSKNQAGAPSATFIPKVDGGGAGSGGAGDGASGETAGGNGSGAGDGSAGSGEAGVTGEVAPAPITVKPEFENNKGSFSLIIPKPIMGAEGLYVIEIVAKSKGKLEASTAVVVKNIPDVPVLKNEDGTDALAQPVVKNPVIVWVDGVDVYGVGVYQGKLDNNFKHFPRSEMKEGGNNLEMTATADNGLVANGAYTANKECTLSANFANVGGAEYLSGMPVVVKYGNDPASAGPVVQVHIDSVIPVSSVTYEITGEDVPGGNVTVRGSAKFENTSLNDPAKWVAEIPLANLPVRVTKIKVTVKAGGLVKVISGSVSVVRPKEPSMENDKNNIYGFAGSGTYYSESNRAYLLNNGSKYLFYANYPGPVTVTVSSSKSGLEAEMIGNNLIAVSATKDGYYRDVSIRVKDCLGDTHRSSYVDFVADSTAPVINLTSPENLDWVKNKITISGNVTDINGVNSVEYSIDNGTTWKKMYVKSGNSTVYFSESVDISELPEGLVTVDLRATDDVGKITYLHSSNYKDVTPPEVSVVQPLELDVVNGTNLIVFNAKDNVALESVNYISPGRRAERVSVPVNPLISTLIGTGNAPIDDDMSFEFIDYAGNKTKIDSWNFSIDNKSDLPIAEIHVPDDMQVITRDFSISGVVYDDDGDSSIYYKIDDGRYKQVAVNEVYMKDDPDAKYELSSSYSISVPFETMTDNEHVISVYAVDVNGVEGPVAKRTFRVSTEEPKGAVLTPTIDKAVRGITVISGEASDNNGIEKVQISLDNGASYNDAVGTTNWTYTVDTRVIPGGTQVVFLKVFDKYGIESLYSSLINIDNDAPELNLDLPIDESTTNGTLFFSGYTFDNVEVKDLYVTIRSLDRTMTPIVKKLNIDSIIGDSIDMTDLRDGFYNVEVTSNDAADNVTNVSRNIHLKKSTAPAVVDILYPLTGEHKNGEFTIYGQSEAESPIQALNLYIDGKFAQETSITGSGFYKFDMNPETITEGTHTYKVDAVLEDGTRVSSREQTIVYNPYGPWITIDNFTYGDFAIERPKIQGRAGYSVSEEDLLLMKDKHTPKQIREEIANRKVKKIEISFNNGKTFTEISKKGKWDYRIENQDLAAGYHFMFIKATMMNGEVAINRSIIQIDNEKPNIRLKAPSVGGRYNQILSVSGLSSDDVKLEDVTIALRKGDKSSYSVPSFIQGLYLDAKLGGAALFQVGAGLTFFDDVVKVQACYGQLTREQFSMLKKKNADFRIGGHIFGLKILANVAEIPFNYFFGHDFDWLSATVAIGADFSWFSSSGRPVEGQKDTGKFVSALVGQLEFPRVTFKKAKAFSSFAAYTECAVWVFPTDIQSTSAQKVPTIIPKVSFGLRTNIF